MSLYKYTPSVANRLNNPLTKPSTLSTGEQFVYFDYAIWNSTSRVLTLKINYTAKDITLNGLGLRFHYDSTKATYEKESTYGTILDHKTTFKVDKSKSTTSDFSIDGVMDPTLSLVRGKTYTFEMTEEGGHPFYLKSKSNSSSTNDEYKTGVTRIGSSNSSSKNDKLVFQVPLDAPDTLWYHMSYHLQCLVNKI